MINANQPDRRRLACGLLLGASAWALASAGQAAEAAPGAVDEVVVTGSRIQQPGLVAPTPVTALNAEDLQRLAPSNTADALNKLPQFQNSLSNVQSRTFSATDPTTVQGNYLNLRGLGVNRVLVLLDGVRVPPTDANGGVDLNTLPQMLVSRVDVVTGGASAAYGSDAVTGVVNLILDKQFTGLKGFAQYGLSSRSDNESHKFGLAYGADFADGRGHILASAEHYRVAGLRLDDRPASAGGYVFTGLGTAASPSVFTEDVRFNGLTYGGLITAGPLAGNMFLPDGSVARFNPGRTTGSAALNSGGDGARYQRTNSLSSPLRTDQLFLRLAYDVTPNLKAHAQASFAESRSVFDTANPAFTAAQITIFADNPFLSPAVRARLGTAASFGLGRLSRDLPPNHADVLNNALNVKLGLEGAFLDNWGWDLSYSYGRAQLREKSEEINLQNFYAGVDAARNAAGNIVCRATIANPGLYQGCAPINLLGEGNVTPEAIAWLRRASQFQIVNQLHDVALNLHGDLGRTWAGPIAVAVGAEARHQSLRQTTNADPATLDAFTGIRGVPAGSLHFNRLNAGVASGEVNVQEAYAEAQVPLLRDAPLAQALDLNGAARVTHYSTSGTVVTWKAGLSDKVSDDLRLRATYSRDIAAPTLYQLFAGSTVTTSAVGFQDVHTGTTGSFRIINRGNPDLKPEVAKTLTLGAVYQPSWLPGFTATIDYYHIKIRDAVNTLSFADVNTECENSGGTAPSCALIERPLPFADRSAANFVRSISVAPLNVASLERDGFDMEFAYRTPLSSVFGDLPGDVSIRAFGSYSANYKLKSSAAAATVNYAGAVGVNGGALSFAYPKFTGSVELGYTLGRLRVAVVERYTGTYTVRNGLTVYRDFDRVPGLVYTDLNASYRFGADERLEGFVAIQNVFDQDPPTIAINGNPGLSYPTNKQNFDVVGTYGTVGIRFRY